MANSVETQMPQDFETTLELEGAAAMVNRFLEVKNK